MEFAGSITQAGRQNKLDELRIYPDLPAMAAGPIWRLEASILTKSEPKLKIVVLGAFSSREPDATSLENALTKQMVRNHECCRTA
jgi:hypothetical protein